MKAPQNRLEAVVDFMRINANGNPSASIVNVGDRTPTDIACDVLIVGGGIGGVAAAAAAARHGARVCLLEETDWLGGQLSSQGVAALDEHAYIESFGGTASYYALREAIRGYYRQRAGGELKEPINPGNCWVTHLAFEPKVAAAECAKLLDKTGNVTTYLRCKAVAATMDGDTVVSLTAISLEDDRAWRFAPRIVLDATELGDVLPLTGTEYTVGAETVAQTGEPHAQPEHPRPGCVQSFTYPCALELRPAGESHVIAEPEHYWQYRTSQPYSLEIQVHGGEIYSEVSGTLAYNIFATLPGTKGGLWTYRRLIDAQQFPTVHSTDISIINWPGNDYRETSIIDKSPAEVAAALQEAKRVSLGFLRWLQTEAPAQPGVTGAPQLKLRPDVMGSTDGLSKFPYIRESRRIKALHTITEQDVSTQFQTGPRAAPCKDSVGIGWHPIDIHPVAGEVGVSCRTRPFQIPLGALLPVRVNNLVAAGKNLGTTHISNGCYRLHPVEWNTGESAGVLAAFALKRKLLPRTVRDDPALLRTYQDALLSDGVPLAWMLDVPTNHPAFAAVQTLSVAGLLPTDAALQFLPDQPVTAEDWKAWGGDGDAVPLTRGEAARVVARQATCAS